jgi:hypothetical protein
MKRSGIPRTTPLRRGTGIATLAVPVPKKKRCAKAKGGCGEWFTAMRAMQSACGGKCAEAMAVAKRLRAERKADRAKREQQKTQPQWVAIAQQAFNTFIRRRDAGMPCICCGRLSSGAGRERGGEWDAGHFRSRGAAPELRFDERNCHAQLKFCNRRAWDVASYRANLIARIGVAEVESLEGPHPPKKFTIDDLKTITATYRRKARELEKAAK